jgi:hypothetical protein
MLSDICTTSAYWVTTSAVRAKDRRVAVEAGQSLAATRIFLLVSTVKDIVGLVSCVADISPEKSSSHYRDVSKSSSLVSLLDETHPLVQLQSYGQGRLPLQGNHLRPKRHRQRWHPPSNH